MKELKKSLKVLQIDKSWTLFLDRDGVINRKIEGDYVRTLEQFEFIEGVLDGMKKLTKIFGRTIIITNQRGIGRGLMSEEDLQKIHNYMLAEFKKNGVKIDAIYYCPHDYQKQDCECRKPKVGMALQAKKDFPEIDFSKSIIVGDSREDIELGRKLGMITVYIEQDLKNPFKAHLCFDSLLSFSRAI